VLALAASAVIALTGATSCSNGGNGYNGPPTAPPPGAELNSGNIGSSGTFTHRFFSAGTFPYHCTLHAVMTGASVVVSASAPAADTSKAVSILSMSTPPYFSPQSVTIRPGGKVVWTNTDGTAHTVTSGS
jgi:plastocyanin